MGAKLRQQARERAMYPAALLAAVSVGGRTLP